VVDTEMSINRNYQTRCPMSPELDLKIASLKSAALSV